MVEDPGRGGIVHEGERLAGEKFQTCGSQLKPQIKPICRKHTILLCLNF